LQGIGEDGAEFILAFDNGHQTEYSALLLRLSWRVSGTLCKQVSVSLP
jgi:hypothetical protein